MKNFIIKRLKSKTIWFGGLFILNAVAQSFGFGDWMPGGEIESEINLIIGGIIWGLREVTNKGLKDK